MSGPSTIYTPKPLSVVNFNFEDSPGTLPPTGWQVGNITSTPTYDTTTPYEGAVSLIVTAAAQYGAMASVAKYPVAQGQVYEISAALKMIGASTSISAQWAFYDAGGNYIGGFSATTASTSWVVVSQSGTVPASAVYAQIYLQINGASGGAGEFDAVQVTLLSTAIPYYLSLLTSQYQNSPNLKAFAALLLQPFVDTAICAAGLSDDFSIADAVGSQLDAIGRIVGASRQLPFSPVGISATTTAAITVTGVQSVTVSNTTNMTVGGLVLISGVDTHIETVTILSVVQGVSFNANFTQTHNNGSNLFQEGASSLLGDSDYRVLLQAKIIQNQFNGQYMGARSELWAAWQTLFPGGTIYITDNQNMSATIILAGLFTPVQQQMITNGLIIPRAQAVQFTFTFATLPIFGFDGADPALIAGFDVGHWA